MAKHKIRIRLKAYDHRVIDQSAVRIVETAERTGALVVGPVPLPTRVERYTVRRPPFTDTRPEECVEVRTHKRLIDILDPNDRTLYVLEHINLPAGVDVEMVSYGHGSGETHAKKSEEELLGPDIEKSILPKRWYLAIRHVGASPEVMIDRISNYIKQRKLGKTIPRVCFEKVKRKRQAEYYLFLAIVSEKEGILPSEANQLIEDLKIGSPLPDPLSYYEIVKASWISGEIETTSFTRQLKAYVPVIVRPENPFDLSQHETVAGNAENHNKLHYWLSAATAGTWQVFRYACKILGLTEDNVGARHLFRRLRLLGHVEYFEDGGKWKVCPACLVQTEDSSRDYFLAGQRTPGMLEELKKLSTIKPSSQADRGAPDIIQLSLDTPIKARSVVEELTKSGYPIHFAGRAGSLLATLLPDLGGWQANLRTFSIASETYEIHRWDGRGFNQWVECPTELGMYRFRRAEDDIQYFVFYDPERGECLQGDWYGLRYLANQYLHSQPYIYADAARRIAIPHEFRLPDLYERSLVLASGQLPQASESSLVFQHIPIEMLDMLSAKLHFEIKDWQHHE